MFTAFALIASYIESLIPFYFGIPGVKLGLTNAVIVLVLYLMGTKEALAVSFARILLAGFLFGNLYSILYSLAGGMLSFLVMVLLKRWKRFSVVGVSMAGGVFHNVGQILVAMAVVENVSLAYYMPPLLISGAVSYTHLDVYKRQYPSLRQRAYPNLRKNRSGPCEVLPPSA